MKTITFTLFLALICSIGFAQIAKNPFTTKIDSVQNLLNKNPIEDITKIKRFNDLALLC